MNKSINIKKTLKQIKHLRIYKGLSQQKIAELLHIDLRSYTRFERGENKTIDICFLNDVSQVLDTDLSYILGFDTPTTEVLPPNPIEQIDPMYEEELYGREYIIKHYINLLTHKDKIISELYELIDKLTQKDKV